MKKLLKSSLVMALLGVMSLSATAGVTVAASAASFENAPPIVTTPTGYTSAEQVKYEKAQNKYVKNWGARGEDCTFLSTYAQSFYTPSTSFESLSAISGGQSQSSAPSSQLYKSLQQTMKSKHSYIISYNATRDLYKYTDCVSNDSTKISSFYSGEFFNSEWDKGETWNREHTWPNSKGLEGSDEDDIMMLRPTLKTENGSRGNKAYGESSGYQRLNENVKGDCARIVLYVYVRWGNTGKMWGQSGVIESLEVLLRWMEEDPVDTWEMGRNDAVQSITGTRNIFIDYPEYAWLLFGEEVPNTVTTPSGEAKKGVSTGENEGNSSSGSEDADKNEGNSSSGSEDDYEIPTLNTSPSLAGCGSSIGLSMGCISLAILGGYVLKRRSK